MTQAVEKYANMLRELKIPADVVDQALDIYPYYWSSLKIQPQIWLENTE